MRLASQRPWESPEGPGAHLWSEEHACARLGVERVGSFHLKPLQLLRILPEVLTGESIFVGGGGRETRVSRCGSGLGKLRHNNACPRKEVLTGVLRRDIGFGLWEWVSVVQSSLGPGSGKTSLRPAEKRQLILCPARGRKRSGNDRSPGIPYPGRYWSSLITE